MSILDWAVLYIKGLAGVVPQPTLTLMSNDDMLENQVHHILLYEWDPIGISSVINVYDVDDEYDRYIAEICKMIRTKQSAQQLYEYLHWVEEERMGLDVNEGHTMRIAQRLANLSISVV